MKMYFYNNAKCMGIQAGIQPLHAVVELLVKYEDDSVLNSKFVDMSYDWAVNHKTVAVLKGGGHHDLEMMLSLLQGNTHSPFAEFREEDLNDSLTSIAVLCTDDMVDDMAAYRKKFISDDEMHEKYGTYADVLIILALARSAN